MSSTNKTPNYVLPQFIGSDVPSWLNDFNDAMNKIDTAIKAAESTANSASGKADTANASASANAQAIATLTTLANKINSDLAWTTITGYSLTSTDLTEQSITVPEIIGKKEVRLVFRNKEEFRFVNDGSSEKHYGTYTMINGTITDGYTMNYNCAVNFSTGKVHVKANLVVNPSAQPYPTLTHMSVRNL